MKQIVVMALGCLALMSAPAFAGSETLAAAPYPSNPPWKNITSKTNGEQKLLEWIPADQNENAIKDILTEQVFFKLKNADLAAFIANVFRSSTQACDHVRVNGPKRQTENGYPIAYAQVYCGHQKGTAIDVDIFIKAIAGHDALYVVQREFHRPVDSGGVPGVISFGKNQDAQMKAFMATRAVANDYLVSKVKLCASALCAGTPAQPPGAIIEGQATADQIKSKLGKPSYEDHNPDGRFIYMYDQPNNQVVAYLFDAKGLLIRVRAYQRSGQ